MPGPAQEDAKLRTGNDESSVSDAEKDVSDGEPRFDDTPDDDLVSDDQYDSMDDQETVSDDPDDSDYEDYGDEDVAAEDRIDALTVWNEDLKREVRELRAEVGEYRRVVENARRQETLLAQSRAASWSTYH